MEREPIRFEPEISCPCWLCSIRPRAEKAKKTKSFAMPRRTDKLWAHSNCMCSCGREACRKIDDAQEAASVELLLLLVAEKAHDLIHRILLLSGGRLLAFLAA